MVGGFGTLPAPFPDDNASLYSGRGRRAASLRRYGIKINGFSGSPYGGVPMRSPVARNDSALLKRP